MKICLIAPVPPLRGGIAKYCYSLAVELEKRHELLLLSYRRQYPTLLYGSKNQRDQSYNPADVQAQFSNLSYNIDTVSIISWRKTARIIGQFGPDIVIFPWWVVYWAPMYIYLMRYLKRRGVRCLLICINVFEHEDSFVKKILSKYVIRQADLLLVHSQQELKQLHGINNHASIRKHLLPLFSYDSVTAPRSDCSLHLLFFGFVRPYKGLDILLRALALTRDLDVVLKVAGEFWDGKEECLTLVSELGLSGRVEIVDRYLSDTEMSSYFSWADLVVLPYRTTKTSGVIATSYGFGTPVLATNVGGFHEVVEDGFTGKLVAPNDPQAIAEGIRWFNDNRDINFKDNIASFVEHRMSWRSLVDSVEEMVEHAG